MMESKPITNSNGTTHWKLPDGTIHREDGPAIIYSDGYKIWIINGINVTEQINKWATGMNIDLNNLSDEDKFMIRLYWENYDDEK